MDLSEVRWIREKYGQQYQLPDMTGGIPVIPVSGGADSSFLAILLHRLFPEVPFRMVFTDTGTVENPAEEPEIYNTLDRLEAYLGKKIERLVPQAGLFEKIAQYGGFLPGASSRWCTRELKLVPFQKWLKQFAGQQKFMYVGINANEADRVAFSIEEAETLTPFIDLGIGRDQVLEGLDRTIGIPSSYKRRVRSGCGVCPFQRRAELVGLWQEKPREFLKGEACEKVDPRDLERWDEAMPLWKDSGIALNHLTLPRPTEGDIEGKTAKRAPDLFGRRLYVGAEFFMDGWISNDEFIWHQRVVSVAPDLHHMKQQLDDRYQHLLRSGAVYQMSADDVRQKARFAIYVVQLSNSFDPEGPKHPGYVWIQGWSYRQLRHAVSWVTRALHAEGMRQIANSTVRSELSVEAEWRDGAQEGLAQTTEELGEIVASQWYRPNEVERVMSEEEELAVLTCPMCSF